MVSAIRSVLVSVGRMSCARLECAHSERDLFVMCLVLVLFVLFVCLCVSVIGKVFDVQYQTSESAQLN